MNTNTEITKVPKQFRDLLDKILKPFEDHFKFKNNLIHQFGNTYHTLTIEVPGNTNKFHEHFLKFAGKKHKGISVHWYKSSSKLVLCKQYSTSSIWLMKLGNTLKVYGNTILRNLKKPIRIEPERKLLISHSVQPKERLSFNEQAQYLRRETNSIYGVQV